MIARMFGLVMFILPGTVVHAQSDSKPTSLSCEILRIDPDQFGWIERQGVSDDVYVMDAIETFFLFQSPNKPKSNPIDVRSGDAIALRDTYGSDQPCEFVCVTALNRGETVRLRLCTPTTSDLRLAAPVEVEIPLGGSTIVRLSNPAKEGRLTYLWIIAQSFVRSIGGEHGWASQPWHRETGKGIRKLKRRGAESTEEGLVRDLCVLYASAFPYLPNNR